MSLGWQEASGRSPARSPHEWELHSDLGYQNAFRPHPAPPLRCDTPPLLHCLFVDCEMTNCNLGNPSTPLEKLNKNRWKEKLAPGKKGGETRGKTSYHQPQISSQSVPTHLAKSALRSPNLLSPSPTPPPWVVLPRKVAKRV